MKRAMHGRHQDDDFVKLSPETLSYYRRVSETLKSEFANNDDPESKSLFIQNVFSQLCSETDLVAVTQNQTTSYLLEPLIAIAPADHLFNLFLALRPHWLIECKHRFASHVLQTILTSCAVYLNRTLCSPGAKSRITPQTEVSEATEDEETGLAYTNLRNLFLEFFAFMLKHFQELLFDKYAGHILRVVLEVLGSVSVSEGVIRSRVSRGQSKNKPSLSVQAMGPCSNDFRKQLHILCRHLIKLPDLDVAVKDAVVNPVIQTMLLVLHKRNPEKCAKYCVKILNRLDLDVASTEEEDDEEEKSEDRLLSLPAVVEDQVASYLLEQLIMLSANASDDHIFTSLFQHRILVFANHPVANYVLQKFLTTITNKAQLKEILSDLSEHLEQILYLNHMWVIVRLAEACVRLRSCQRKLLKSLMMAIHCNEPETRRDKLVPLLASLTTFDVFYGDDNKQHLSDVPADDKEDDSSSKISADEPVVKAEPQLTTFNYHGSVILQHLLRLVDTKLLVNSFLKLCPAELVRMSTDPCGSHIVEAYFQSDTVGVRDKHTACNKLKDQWMEIACNRHGSRMLEALWKELTANERFCIANELSQNHERLRTDQFGRHINRHLALHYFIHRRSDWKEMQGSAVKKRKLFEDIIGTSKAIKPSVTVSGSDGTRLQESKVQRAEGEPKVIEERIQIDDLFTMRRSKQAFDEIIHDVNPSQTEKIKLGKRKKGKS